MYVHVYTFSYLCYALCVYYRTIFYVFKLLTNQQLNISTMHRVGCNPYTKPDRAGAGQAICHAGPQYMHRIKPRPIKQLMLISRLTCSMHARIVLMLGG